MRKFLCGIYTVLGASTLLANTIATQVVTMSITAVNELAITGTAPTLTIGSATAGALPNPAVSTGITYSYTTNSTGTTSKKIVGSLDSNMSTNLTLSAKLSVPSSGGGTSAGALPLSTTATTLVSVIPVPSHQLGQNLVYTFAQTSDVATMTSFTRTITLTMLDS